MYQWLPAMTLRVTLLFEQDTEFQCILEHRETDPLGRTSYLILSCGGATTVPQKIC